jgi:hypothetical protein
LKGWVVVVVAGAVVGSAVVPGPVAVEATIVEDVPGNVVLVDVNIVDPAMADVELVAPGVDGRLATNVSRAALELLSVTLAVDD